MAERIRGWIGVDLDGTLAHYSGWVGPTEIGAPVPEMVERVRRWLAEDIYDVKIFTARVSTDDPEERAAVVKAVTAWCWKQFRVVLEVTCMKDLHMIELWDDRCVQVIPNTGRPVGSSTRGLE